MKTGSQLPAPEYTEEEREKIIQYFIYLKGDLIRRFLAERGLVQSGDKSELKERIEDCLESGEFQYQDLVNYLDALAPYGKQHVILFDGLGGERELEEWRSYAFVEELLKKNDAAQYLNARLPLISPEDLKLSSIEYKPERMLNVFAVGRREYWERREEFDEKRDLEGLEVELRAYAHQVIRVVVIFRWDLVSNTATLQISQLESGTAYEKVEEQFKDLVKEWLNWGLFKKMECCRAIEKLHESEESHHPETRLHGIDYRTNGGRSVSAQSSSSQDPLLGEPPLDGALHDIREDGIGQLGNFYWLPSSVNPAHGNPLKNEVHTIIVGSKQRVNFTTPNEEKALEYVLYRLRELSR